MSKQLSHREILDVIREAIEGEAALATQDQVYALVADMAELVASHLGYTVIGSTPPIEEPPDESSQHTQRAFDQCWAVGFLPNECTPTDGGLLAAYDTDITLKEWWEQAGLDPVDVVEPVSTPSREMDWRDAFNRIVDRQGWGPDSERTLLLEFIEESDTGNALPAFAARVAARDNSVPDAATSQEG